MAPIGSSDHAAVSFSISFPRTIKLDFYVNVLGLQTIKLLRGTLLALTGLAASIQSTM